MAGLTGNEVLQVQGVDGTGRLSSQTFQTTTSAIAALAALDTSSAIITTLATVGAGTLVAAALVGRHIVRTGTQVAGFTDTTDTAAAIIAALPGAAPVGTSFVVSITNSSVGGFAQTVTGGTGVTVSGITTIQNGNWAEYLVTYTAANTITMVGYLGGFGTTFFNNLGLAGLLFESATDSITGGTAGQSTATALTTEVNRVTTVTAGTGVALPAAVAGLTILVINHGANALQVYGNNTSADTIDDVATATGVQQMIGSMTLYTCTTGGAAGKWYSEGLGTGYSGSFQTVSFTDGITAHAGGGQGSAVALTTGINNLTTVATYGDSVLLPVSAAGMQVTVANNGAKTAAVFPAASETISGLPAARQVTLAPNSSVTFSCTAAGKWTVALPVPQAQWNAINVTVGTLAQFIGSGAAFVGITSNNATPGAQTTRTATQMFDETPGAYIGMSFILRVINTGAGTLTLTAGAGFSAVTGTATVAQNVFRDYIVTFTSSTAGTIQSVGSGVSP